MQSRVRGPLPQPGRRRPQVSLRAPLPPPADSCSDVLVLFARRVFGFEGARAEDIAYANWLSLLHAGVAKALETYDPTSGSWLQAHSQARYVILRVLLEAGEGLVSVEETRPGEYLLLRLDRAKMASVGRLAVGDFLHKLQVFKSCGDVAAARAVYEKYSEVPEDGPHPWARWRDIVLAHKQPRKMLVQPNTFLKGQYQSH